VWRECTSDGWPLRVYSLGVEMTATEVTLQGVNIAYRDSGGTDPIPVILVHGMGGDGHTWDHFARILIQNDRRVVIPDLRGHGRSAHTTSYLFDEFGDDVARLCESLELTKVDLVGHSLGGYAVSRVAANHPGLVRRLVVEECPLPLRAGDPPTSMTGRFPTPPELWHAASSVLRHPRTVLAFDRSMTKSALAQFRMPNQLWWEQLSVITASTLILRGGAGGMVDPVKLEAVVATMNDCRAVRIKSGHSIHRDRYSDFEAAVLPFLMAS
jgi:esterase